MRSASFLIFFFVANICLADLPHKNMLSSSWKVGNDLEAVLWFSDRHSGRNWTGLIYSDRYNCVLTLGAYVLEGSQKIEISIGRVSPFKKHEKQCLPYSGSDFKKLINTAGIISIEDEDTFNVTQTYPRINGYVLQFKRAAASSSMLEKVKTYTQQYPLRYGKDGRFNLPSKKELSIFSSPDLAVKFNNIQKKGVKVAEPISTDRDLDSGRSFSVWSFRQFALQKPACGGFDLSKLKKIQMENPSKLQQYVNGGSRLLAYKPYGGYVYDPGNPNISEKAIPDLNSRNAMRNGNLYILCNNMASHDEIYQRENTPKEIDGYFYVGRKGGFLGKIQKKSRDFGYTVTGIKSRSPKSVMTLGFYYFNLSWRSLDYRIMKIDWPAAGGGGCYVFDESEAIAYLFATPKFNVTNVWSLTTKLQSDRCIHMEYTKNEFTCSRTCLKKNPKGKLTQDAAYITDTLEKAMKIYSSIP